MRSIETLPQALERIADLEIEIKFLKSELGLSKEESVYAYLRKHHGMRLNEAWTAMALYRRKGQVISNAFLYDNRPSISCDTNLSLQDVKVTVCSLRKSMPPGSIETHFGMGYSMTSVGAAFMKEALARIAHEFEGAEADTAKTSGASASK